MISKTDIIYYVQEHRFLSIHQDFRGDKTVYMVKIPIRKYKTREGFAAKAVKTGTLGDCKSFINRLFKGHQFPFSVQVQLIADSKIEVICSGLEIQLDPQKTFSPGEEEALTDELNKLMRTAISRHLFWGEKLYIATLSDYRGNRIYPILAENQSLYMVPVGPGGGNRWPRYVAARSLLHPVSAGVSFGFKSTSRGWKLKKIEALSLDGMELGVIRSQ